VKTKKTKAKYHLRNWKEYNESLVNRGSLTIWFNLDVVSAWSNQPRTGKRGRPRDYPESAILTMATLQEIYRLPLRQAEGFLRSIFELLKLEMPVPDFSTLARRRAALEIKLPKRRPDEPLHVVVDSSGIKVFGEGEWKVRQHGYTYRRTWRKIHLGVDEASGEILAAVVTTNNYTDSQVLPELLDQITAEIDQVSADGAYDKRNCYKAIRKRKAKAAIPPRRNAKVWRHGNTKGERLARDKNLRRIRKVGRATWKKESGYHRRSLAETAVFRLKLIFGGRVSARSFHGQAAQLLIRCATLNRMMQLGMPDSYKVA
jgi:IS5 family transposase